MGMSGAMSLVMSIAAEHVISYIKEQLENKDTTEKSELIKKYRQDYCHLKPVMDYLDDYVGAMN